MSSLKIYKILSILTVVSAIFFIFLTYRSDQVANIPLAFYAISSAILLFMTILLYFLRKELFYRLKVEKINIDLQVQVQDRKKAEKELEKLNSSLEQQVKIQVDEITKSTMLIETIFNTVKDGLAVVDLESNFLLVNDSYSKMIGFSQQELYKLSCVGLTAPHMIEESKKILKIVLESGRYEGYVKQCVNKNNSIIDVKMDILLMLDKKTILLSSKNITNELKYKREVKDKEDQLLQQSRLAQMGEMISMIAHQWRQPLSAISSTSIDLQTKIILESSQIEDKKDVAEFATYFDTKLEDINNFVQILTTTIEDFRNFYKPNKDSVTIKLEEVIKKSLNIIQASLISDNIEIIEEHNATESIELYESEMMQVILNLLKNTQDNFKEKNTQNPYIKIVTKNKSIEICDNGGGIPENIIEKIFDPYFSTKHEKNGTGLGLYMSKTIVEEHHHGKLSATNSENGVCFKISL